MKTINKLTIIYSALILSLFLVTVISCGGGGDRDSASAINTPPTVPNLTGPTDKSLCISNSVVLSWNASTDSQNDAITYQIQIATDNLFTQGLISVSSNLPNYSVTLDKGKAYYWRVKATDSKNASSNYSSTYSFYTEGTAVANHLPFMPQLIAPLQNVSINGNTANLEWNASDVDAIDVLTYDLYWGTSMTNLQNNKLGHTNKTYQLTSLSANTTYYWKVVVKDDKGGETIGQIWSFKTN